MFYGKKVKLEKIDEDKIKERGYSEVRLASDERAGVCRDGKWGFVNKEGEEIIPCKYENVEYFENGHCFVQKNEKWGIINKDGKEVVACEYDNIIGAGFPRTLALCQKGNRYYIIGKMGQLYLKAPAGKVKGLVSPTFDLDIPMPEIKGQDNQEKEM